MSPLNSIQVYAHNEWVAQVFRPLVTEATLTTANINKMQVAIMDVLIHTHHGRIY